MANSLENSNNIGCSLEEYLDTLYFNHTHVTTIDSIGTELLGSEVEFGTVCNESSYESYSNISYFEAGAIIFIVALYSVMIFSFKIGILSVLGALFKQNTIERIEEENRENVKGVLNFSYYFASPLAAALTITLVTERLFSTSISPYLIFAAATLAIALLMCAKNFLVWTVGYVSEGYNFTKDAILCSKIASFLSLFIITPPLLLLFFNIEPTNLAAQLLIPMALILLTNYIITLYYFFKAQFVSFFQYILYLCGVEIIPISFFVIIFTKLLLL